MVFNIRALVLLCAVAAVYVAPPLAARADVASVYRDTIKPSLVLVAASRDSELSFGTGFCIYAKDGISYFVTDYHVVADEKTDRAYAKIDVLRPNDPTKRYPATLIKGGSVLKDWPPDLALISAPTGNLPVLHISAQRPVEGIRVGIAGFPAFQLDVWLQQSQGTELRPSLHTGGVNSLTLGDFYVQYDALTDQGNSGGPLFDAETGAVYGVVDETVKGSSVSNNLALSDVVVRRFIASLALPVRVAKTDKRLAPPADERLEFDRGDRCTIGMERFSRDFNRLVNARELASTSSAKGMKSVLIARYAQVEALLARHGLAGDLSMIRQSGAKNTAGLATAVYSDLTATTGSPNSSDKLHGDVQRFDNGADCSTT